MTFGGLPVILAKLFRRLPNSHQIRTKFAFDTDHLGIITMI